MSARLDFALRFVDGRGLLGLRAPERVALAQLDRLELEVPQLRFPFDVTGGAARFQTRRCLLTAAELHVDESGLRSWLAERGHLQRFGVSRLECQLADGRILLHWRARVGEREAAATARLTLKPDGGRIALRLEDVRTYAFLGAPGALCGMGLLFGLGAAAADEAVARPGPATLHSYGRPALTLYGVDRVELHPLDLLLWETLPRQGWRLPSTQQAGLAEARIEPGRILIRYNGQASVITDVSSLLDEGDGHLARGELAQAMEAWARVDGADAMERRLGVYAAEPARFDEAVNMARALEQRYPARPAAALALGAVASERGDAAEAAEAYLRALALAEKAGERADIFECSLRAGEELARSGDARATRLLERVLETRQDHPRASSLLAERYAAEQRWRDLLMLERRRLMQAEDESAEASAHARVGRIWLEHLSEPQRARDELERAVRLDAGDAATWELYSRALAESGEPSAPPTRSSAPRSSSPIAAPPPCSPPPSWPSAPARSTSRSATCAACSSTLPATPPRSRRRRRCSRGSAGSRRRWRRTSRRSRPPPTTRSARRCGASWRGWRATCSPTVRARAPSSSDRWPRGRRRRRCASRASWPRRAAAPTSCPISTRGWRRPATRRHRSSRRACSSSWDASRRRPRPHRARARGPRRCW
jgi:tetratricopeptide (TPR) repeat protein